MRLFSLALLALALAAFVHVVRAEGPPPRAYSIVFIGDSITYYWPVAAAFPSIRAIDKGVPGQTTAQMLARFQADVIALHPKYVHILGGVNDLLISFKIPLGATEANLLAMIDQARANGIVPVLGSVLPVGANMYSSRRWQDIPVLNAWLKSVAQADGLAYVDYWSAFNGHTSTLLGDGLHPNAAGYAVMDAALTAFEGWR